MTSTPEPHAAPGDFLPWDSEFFGFRIGRLKARRLTADTLPAALAWAAAERLRCAYLLADADSAETLARAHEGGFKFVDVRVDLAADLPAGSIADPAVPLRPATAADLAPLEAISRVAHQDTRFFKDTNFPAHRAADLYAEWIRRDFRVHRILVATDADGGILGYVTCQVDPAAATGRIGLIAVAAGHRQRGLGRALVQGALAHFSRAGCRQAWVATQASNVPAQRLYQSLGFRTAETAATFHRWF